ncbi:TPA: hypothetical protein ACSXKA_000714 [Escherichia coli]
MKYKEQRPAVPETHTGRLTTNDSKIIEAAMRNHTIMQLSADMALNEASKIIMADMEVVSHE